MGKDKPDAPVWCEIVFKDSATPKVFEDVRRMYTKGGFFCVEIPEKDSAGRPKILKYPMINIFHVASPHPDHAGAGRR